MDLSHKKLRQEFQSMHSTVIRARVQSCRKLIADIKKISHKKTKDKVKNEKNARKVQRLTSEVHILRHMKPNLIAKFVVSHTEQSIATMIKQPDVCARLKALAKVSSHKLIKPLVDEFHERFPKWQETLPKLLEKDLDIIGVQRVNVNDTVDENQKMADNENIKENEEDSSDSEQAADENISSESSDENIESNKYKQNQNKMNDEQNDKSKTNSRKVPAKYPQKLSLNKLKTTCSKRKLSKTESSENVSESDEKKSKAGSNVKNWLILTDKDSTERISESESAKSDGEEKSIINNLNKENSISNGSAVITEKLNNNNFKQCNDLASSKNRNRKKSIPHKNDPENLEKNTNNSINKSCSDNEESSKFAEQSVANNDLASSKNRNRKKSIPHKEDDKSHENETIKNKSKLENIESDDDQEINLKNEYNQRKNQITEKKLELVQQKQEDPFFMTKDNSKYMTFGKIEEPKLEVAPLSVSRSFEKRTSSKLWNNEQYFTDTKNVVNKTANANKFRNTNDRNGYRSEEVNQQLHPSWEAKKRKSTLVPFQGKKISFGD